jgi:hypothetical protein
MYFRPSEYTTSLLQTWHDTCIELNKDDQIAFNHVFSAGIRKDMDYYIMPKELYPHGALIEQVCAPDQSHATSPSGLRALP